MVQNFKIADTLEKRKDKVKKLINILNRRCHEKTSYVSYYAFFTLLHKWIDIGRMHRLEKLQ